MPGAVFDYRTSGFHARGKKALLTYLSGFAVFLFPVSYGVYRLGIYGVLFLAILLLIFLIAIAQPINWMLIGRNEGLRIDAGMLFFRSWTGRERSLGAVHGVRMKKKVWSLMDVAPACYYFVSGPGKGRAFAHISNVDELFRTLGIPEPPESERVWRLTTNTRPR
jgi:hypothetical protein